MRDFGDEIPGLPKLLDVLLCDKGGHPPALKIGSGHGRGSEVLKLKPWVLELEVREGKDRAWKEKDWPWPLYKEGEYQASSAWPFGTCLKSRSHTSRHDGVIHARIDENPMKKGTRSLLRHDVPIKPPRNTCSGRLGKTVRNDRTMA